MYIFLKEYLHFDHWHEQLLYIVFIYVKTAESEGH